MVGLRTAVSESWLGNRHVNKAVCACLHRYEQQQAIVQEELARIARKEREAARQDITRAVQRERVQTRQESEKAKQLVRLFYKTLQHSTILQDRSITAHANTL